MISVRCWTLWTIRWWWRVRSANRFRLDEWRYPGVPQPIRLWGDLDHQFYNEYEYRQRISSKEMHPSLEAIDIRHFHAPSLLQVYQVCKCPLRADCTVHICYLNIYGMNALHASTVPSIFPAAIQQHSSLPSLLPHYYHPSMRSSRPPPPSFAHYLDCLWHDPNPSTHSYIHYIEYNFKDCNNLSETGCEGGRFYALGVDNTLPVAAPSLLLSSPIDTIN